MIFQVLDAKGWYFLELLGNNLNPIEPSYAKGGLWLKFFSHSNSLCTRASRVIVNHAPIEEYHLRFFPKNISNVHIVFTSLNWGDTFYIIVWGTTTTRI